MPDYGRSLEFGYFLIPNAADPLIDTAREVDRLGLDYIGVQDHPYQRRFVDTWTLTDLALGVGFDTFVLWADRPDQLARFATEVVPAVRDQVAQERGG